MSSRYQPTRSGNGSSSNSPWLACVIVRDALAHGTTCTHHARPKHALNTLMPETDAENRNSTRELMNNRGGDTRPDEITTALRFSRIRSRH